MNPTAAPPPAPRLFDRALLRARLARAAASSQAADFLLVRAADDLGERLASITRTFDKALDLATPGPHFADQLHASGKAAFIARAPAIPGPGAQLAADLETLPLAPGSLNLIISGLALHTVNDLPGAFLQIRRALAPDGLFLAALPAGRTLEELRISLALAEDELHGGVSPRVAPFADLKDLGALLQRAGFALPVVDSDSVIVRYDNLFALMRDLRAMGATNILTERSRKPSTRALFLRAAEIYAARFADSDGRIRATFEIIWLSGWAPHESQQKPLRPGSAQMRLADALGNADK